MVILEDNRSTESRVRITLDQIRSRMEIREGNMIVAEVTPACWLLAGN